MHTISIKTLLGSSLKDLTCPQIPKQPLVWNLIFDRVQLNFKAYHLFCTPTRDRCSDHPFHTPDTERRTRGANHSGYPKGGGNLVPDPNHSSAAAPLLAILSCVLVCVPLRRWWEPQQVQGSRPETSVFQPFSHALKKEMTTHPSILAWKMPWPEKPSGLQSMVSKRVGHNLVIKQQQSPLVTILGPGPPSGLPAVSALPLRSIPGLPQPPRGNWDRWGCFQAKSHRPSLHPFLKEKQQRWAGNRQQVLTAAQGD